MYSYQQHSNSAIMVIWEKCIILLVIISCWRCSGNIDEIMISTELVSFVQNATNSHRIQERFQMFYDNGSLVKEEINGTILVREFVSKLETLFEEKKEALLNIKAKAESEVHRNVTKGPIANFTYPNMRTVDEDDNNTLRIDEQFSTKVKVNTSKSFVHIPTNIYAYKQEVLKTVRWTDGLDEVFLYNMNVSDTLLYQYYGDHSGFLRVYPGNKNNVTKDTKMDLYDCRRRPWYVQVTSSPKDLVIIIDLSGSMIGSNIGIAKIATSSLIDTLEENDFFNVITVNDKVNPMKACLLQATKKNKESMKNLVRKIEDPSKTLDQKKGLEAAFEMLNSGPQLNRSYASCNRVIMFITDGIESDYKEEQKIFEKYNADKSVRVFSFLVGRKKNPEKQALVSMACENRGYFYKLETLGNVWDTVLEYLHVMSRPLINAKKNQKAMYTPIYLDSTGLGMIMSISMGVFGNDSLFMGVAGTDVTINSLNDIIPKTDLGIFGHAFVITNNGFILMHPNLREQTPATDPLRLPAPPNILLEDIEYSIDKDDMILLKRNMIDHEYNGSNSFPVYCLYDNDSKLMEINATYDHQFINDTEFIAAIVLSDSEQSQLHFNQSINNSKLLVDGIKALEAPFVNMSIPNITIENYTYIQVASFNYCDIQAAARAYTPLSIATYPTADEIFEVLKDVTTWDTLPSICSNKLTRDLLISAAIVTSSVEESWTPELIYKYNDILDAVFVATTAGYSKYFTHNNDSYPYNRDVLKTPLFKYALANPDAKVIFSASYAHSHSVIDNNKEAKLITAIAPIRIGDDDQILAVSGLKFKPDYMKEFLFNATIRELPDPMRRESMIHDCDDKNTHICALLDQNAFIIASNLGSKYVGRFLGEHSVSLIDHLLRKSLLKRITLNDTQGECPHPSPSSSSASIMLTPAKLIFRGTLFLLKTISWLVVKSSLFLISIFQTKYANGIIDLPDDYISCTKVTPYHLFDFDKVKELLGRPTEQIPCSKGGPCLMNLEVIRVVPDTNLIVLQVGHKTDCVSECRKPGIMEVKKVMDENVCDTSRSWEDRYRKRPNTCFNTTKPGYKCGVATAIKPQLVILIAFLSVVFIIHS